MALVDLITEPCIVSNPGSPTKGTEGAWEPGAPTTVDGFAYLNGVGAQERLSDDRSVQELRAYLLPTSLTVTARSTITVRGQDWQVVGPAEKPRHPLTGATPYIKCQIAAVS